MAGRGLVGVAQVLGEGDQLVGGEATAHADGGELGKPASVACRLRVVRMASFIEESRVPSVVKAFNSTMQVVC